MQFYTNIYLMFSRPICLVSLA